MVEYDSPLKGQTHIKNVREQIQEDIIALREEYGWNDHEVDDLCQIVVDNFKKLEKE